MGKFGGFLSRKPVIADSRAAPTPLPDNPLELDEELFSTLGARVGGENEALRNLLLNANTKINELDSIKDAVARLADPVGKALAAYETEKSEKIGLQAVLNNTRTAYGKLRNEMADLEKRQAVTQSECLLLRQELISTQDLLKSAEATKQEISIDVAARRAQIGELEARLGQADGDTQALREENRRLDDRLIAAEKRIVVLESDLNSTRQRLLMNEDEKRSLQSSLDKSVTEAARLQRKLAETETSLTTVHGRLRHVEANFAETSTERARLANALEEANERHEHERNSQRIRLDALQARVGATEKLLGEAREHLLARADEIRNYDRKLGEMAQARDTIQAQSAELGAERLRRESEFEELRQVHATLKDRSAALARAYNAKDVELTRTVETNAALGARVGALEDAIRARQETTEKALEDLTAALRREKHERAVAEGALDTGRKDFARLMREVMTLQRDQAAREPGPNPFAANAA
jgi:chromosome segregation ATPase